MFSSENNTLYLAGCHVSHTFQQVSLLLLPFPQTHTHTPHYMCTRIRTTHPTTTPHMLLSLRLISNKLRVQLAFFYSWQTHTHAHTLPVCHGSPFQAWISSPCGVLGYLVWQERMEQEVSELWRFAVPHDCTLAGIQSEIFAIYKSYGDSFLLGGHVFFFFSVASLSHYQ